MLIVERDATRWTLRRDEQLLLLHTKTAPFATMIRLEKQYSANRGTVKTQVVETERILLTELEETGNGVSFSGGGHTLQVSYQECEGGAELHFAGEPGWTYQFRLPAVD